MKVWQLKEILEDVDENLEVYVYADHGQMTMSASFAGIQHVEELIYSTETIHEDDLEEFPDAVKVFEIAN